MLVFKITHLNHHDQRVPKFVEMLNSLYLDGIAQITDYVVIFQQAVSNQKGEFISTVKEKSSFVQRHRQS
jgi:hypothetical protein